LLEPSFYRIIYKTSFILSLDIRNMKNLFKFVFETLKIIVIALAIVIPIRYFLFQPFFVDGVSMSPNYNNGDYLIVDEITYKLREPQRGEVVVFRSPVDPTQRYIKRIIGLPGETVEVSDGLINIIGTNGRTILNESEYFSEPVYTGTNVTILLEEDEYFVLGDNRGMSYDSRRWGILPKSNIIGKTWIRLLPINSLSKFSTPQYSN
jgi:signal peptidase I